MATLTVHNHGDTPIRISPGFHPYFSAEHSEFDFNGQQFNAEEIAHTEFVTAPQESKVGFGDLKISIETQNLPVYALWSDRNGSYTCAEPTAEGYAFMQPAQDIQFVTANSKKQFSVKFGLQAA